jgi:hypothetical protein
MKTTRHPSTPSQPPAIVVIILQHKSIWPAQLPAAQLQQSRRQHRSGDGRRDARRAAALLSFVFLQRFFVDSIVGSAIKG